MKTSIMKNRKTLNFVALLLGLCVVFGILEAGYSGELEGKYYGKNTLLLAHFGRVEIEVPCVLTVMPDGKSIVSSSRVPTGTISFVFRGSFDGSVFRGRAKPSFRWSGPMLARSMDGEFRFKKSPDRVVAITNTVGDSEYEEQVFYKSGTKEGNEIARLWERNDGWTSFGTKFPGKICDLDRGEIPSVGDAVIGNFEVLSPHKSLINPLKLRCLHTVRGKTVELSFLYSESIPRKFSPMQEVRVGRSNPLIVGKVQVFDGLGRIDINVLPVNVNQFGK